MNREAGSHVRGAGDHGDGEEENSNWSTLFPIHTILLTPPPLSPRSHLFVDLNKLTEDDASVEVEQDEGTEEHKHHEVEEGRPVLIQHRDAICSHTSDSCKGRSQRQRKALLRVDGDQGPSYYQD